MSTTLHISQVTHPRVSVEQFFQEHGERLELQLISKGADLDRPIREPTLNRPGLALAGQTRYFARHRIQVLGSMELHWLRAQSAEDRARAYRILFSRSVPAVVLARGLRPDRGMMDAAESAGIPVFRTRHITMKFINRATISLEAMSAARSSMHGSMVDILGVGVVIRGESGIGKSECVLGLLERGYSLVADDVVMLRLHDDCEVVGTSKSAARDFMEIRGIGIIDVARMFGVRAFRAEKRIDMIVTLQHWNETTDVDRLGLEEQYVTVLDVRIPHMMIPVRPGRDLAQLTEVAAMQVKLRKAGHNAAAEMGERLSAEMMRQAEARKAAGQARPGPRRKR